MALQSKGTMLSLKHAHSVMHRKQFIPDGATGLEQPSQGLRQAHTGCCHCIRIVMLLVPWRPAAVLADPHICFITCALDTILPKPPLTLAWQHPQRPTGSLPHPPQQLDCKLSRPLPRGCFVSSAVGLVHVRNLRNKRVIGIGVGEHRADGQKHFGYRESWAPLVSQDV